MKAWFFPAAAAAAAAPVQNDDVRLELPKHHGGPGIVPGKRAHTPLCGKPIFSFQPNLTSTTTTTTTTTCVNTPAGKERLNDDHAAIFPMELEGTSICSAAASGNYSELMLLWRLAALQGRDPGRMLDEEGNHPLHYAALAETAEVASFIMQQTNGVVLLRGSTSVPLVHLRNQDGETPLLRAVAAGHLPTIKYLVEQGSVLTARDTRNGSTMVHNACRNGHMWALVYLVRAATQALSEDEVTRLLLLPDCEDHTCVEWACFGGHVPLVQYLLRRLGTEAAYNTDLKGRTGLHLAARMHQVAMCRYLVSKVGMDPYAQDAEGKDVFSYASNDRDVVEALKSKKSTAQTIDNTPPRVRPAFFLSYGGFSAVLWMVPFFVAWYIALPFLVFLSGAYRRTAAWCNAAHTPRNKPIPGATWFVAHERFTGFWWGTLLAFALTLPILQHWPTSAAWSSDAETAAATISLAAPTTLALYVSLALLAVLWFDLVFAHPNPGVVVFDEAQYDALMEQVGATAAEPSTKAACHTCMVRKPLRSKHCRDCGYCIARMDHHCVWLDGCVGLQNHGRFLIFLVLHIVSVLLFLGCVLPVLRQAIAAGLPAHLDDASQVLRVVVLRPIFPLLLQSIFALGTTCSLLALLQEQVPNVFRNMTSNERLNGRRYAWITDPTTGRFHNRFDRGAWANFLEFVAGGGRGPDYRVVYELPAGTTCCDGQRAAKEEENGRVSAAGAVPTEAV